jgi:hypothetical protein
MIPSLNDVLTSLEMFSLLVGALSHDVGHEGGCLFIGVYVGIVFNNFTVILAN